MEFLNTLNGIVWGWPMLALIALTGLFLTIGLKAYPIRHLKTGFVELWQGRHKHGEGEISGFNALMTSLSATIGTGNIAGVATAVAMGGPGAIFWMWIIALIGMATKYSEAVLAVRFREQNEQGHFVGGPMYYIRNGLGPKFKWLAVAFAFFGMLAGFGIGNGVQANSVADAMSHISPDGTGIPEWVTGLVVAALVGLVLIGGIRRISDVAGKLVPFMAITYVIAGVVLLGIYANEIPAALELIVTHAFTPISAAGGFAGATVWAAIRFGVARGVFSNEAGLGSAPIAHATATTDSPVRQGTIAMLGTFIDTIVICTITGLVIVASGAWQTGASGASLTASAFDAGLPVIGQYIVTLGLAVFAFTTIIGWSFYGERCTEYLFGIKAVPVFRLIWVAAIPIGATQELNVAWLIADTLNAMMALPNLVALILLSPVVFGLTREYLQKGSQKDL
ncbi:alanine or glycine:cation symporter, AGCS family [Thalassolituus maritimus]|uniref:Alanine or glycine:cation symporter, AGCS family n=1 Tax=Thalassolituus maritimus TaxID=484498 RepID=A0A1N7MAV6_9GAMM|nr:sodium:alanine symporter family protein [Thalassolituus maritimus]SIS83109.1 alanine or glycine:cation symporter, AGCS family [Thalassolituus maritimus]